MRRLFLLAIAVTALACPALAQVNVSQGAVTYRATKVGLVPAATPTDIAVLSGNAASNRTVVTRIIVSCTQTTAGIIDLVILKRSTADTLGTSTTTTAVALDSGSPAASSISLSYTANPTVGTLVGNIGGGKVGCMAPGTATPNDVLIENFSTSNPLVLRGTAEQVAVNLNGVTLTGGSVTITFEWVETKGL